MRKAIVIVIALMIVATAATAGEKPKQEIVGMWQTIVQETGITGVRVYSADGTVNQAQSVPGSMSNSIGVWEVCDTDPCAPGTQNRYRLRMIMYAVDQGVPVTIETQEVVTVRDGKIITDDDAGDFVAIHVTSLDGTPFSPPGGFRFHEFGEKLQIK